MDPVSCTDSSALHAGGYESGPYAPLTESGPLAPGVTAEDVVAAYRARPIHMRPKSVLRSCGIRYTGTEAAHRLRQAVDDPENRAERPKVRPPLHSALYFFLKTHAPRVYEGFVQPAEYERGKRTYLDPELFEKAVSRDPGGASELADKDEVRALALFVVAYGLLQPQDAGALVHSVLRPFAVLRDFFGIGCADASIGEPMGVPAPGATNAAVEAGAKDGAPDGPSTKSRPVSFEAAGQPLTQSLEQGPDDNKGPAADVAGPLATPRATRLRKLEQAVENAISARAEAATARLFDRRAFESLLEREQEAREAFDQEERQILAEAESLHRGLTSALEGLGGAVRPQPLPPSTDAIADYLDSTEVVLRKVTTTLAEAHRRPSSPPARPALPALLSRAGEVSIAALAEAVNEYASLVATAEEQWKSRAVALNALLEQVLDCMSPQPSAGLARLSASDAIDLAEHAATSDQANALVSLILRLAGDKGAFGSDAATRSRGTEVLINHLSATWRKRGVGALQSELSWFPLPLLQEFMRSDNPALVRVTTLACLRESVSRYHPSYFSEIWPGETAWRQRPRDLGGRSWRVLQGLQRAYWQTQSVAALWSSLAPLLSDDGSQSVPEIAVTQNETERVAAFIESTSNMTGRFFRIRQHASSRLLRPLAASLRAGRVTAVADELPALRSRLVQGDLIEELLAEVADIREFETSHRVTLRRFIEQRLDSAEEWLRNRQGTADDRTETGLPEDLAAELSSAVGHLSHAPRGDCDEVGGQDWLEWQLFELLHATPARNWPARSLTFQGDMPSGDSLFANSGVAADSRWPAWLDPDPRSERCWAEHVEDEVVSWSAILQDGVAKLLGGRQRTPREVIQSFLSAGCLQAVMAAGQLPEYSGPEIAGIVEEAATTLARRRRAEDRLWNTSRRTVALRQSRPNELIVKRLAHVERELLAAIDDSADENLAAMVEQRIAEFERQVTELEKDASASAAVAATEVEDLRAWLGEAGYVPPPGSGVAECRRLVQVVKADSVARRAHCRSLEGIVESAEMPAEVRAAVAEFLSAEDRPSRWPLADVAAEVALYVDSLAEATRAWWPLSGTLDARDVTLARLRRLTKLLADRLSAELDALLARDAAQAPLMSAMLERTAWPPTELYRLLVERQVISEDSGEASALAPQIQGVGPAEADGAAAAQASYVQGRWENVVRRSGAIGRPSAVKEAYEAFGAGQYRAAVGLAAAATQWASETGSPERGPLTAVFAWASTAGSEASDRASRLEALGLLFCHNARIREWVPSVTVSRLTDWCIELLGPEDVVPPETQQRGEGLAALLQELTQSPFGSADRERFSTLVRVGGGGFVGPVLWDSLRNLKDDSWRGRAALLVLLFDMNDQEGLRRLFVHAGAQQKYLAAFAALAARARIEPSPRLHAAIRQNLRTLENTGHRAFREFTERVTKSLRFISGRVSLDVSEDLEAQPGNAGAFTMVVTVVPDETDPPITLAAEVVESGDVACDSPEEARRLIVSEQLLLEPREVEFTVRPRDPSATSTAVLRVAGETASGELFDETRSFRVLLRTGFVFAPLGADEILDAYEGYDGRPVTGAAFVGRGNELTVLERSVGRKNPGAVVLYGARRLGKTSLLRELRRRYCVTSRKDGSRTLFVFVPVDEFSAAQPFLDRFLKLIWHSIYSDPANEPLREYLGQLGVTRQALAQSARVDSEESDGASFLGRLRQLLGKVRELTGGRVDQVTLILDEFDKLLEHYRRGYEADVEELINQLRRGATEDRSLGVVLAGSDLMRNVVGHPRSALYGSSTTVFLECFDWGQQRTAIRKIVAPEGLRGRVEFPEDVIAEIVRVTGGHPLFMRLVACGTVALSERRRISRGTVFRAIQGLVRNEVLQGYLPDFGNIVKQPLQALALLDGRERVLAELLLLQLARHTSVERAWSAWGPVTADDRLQACAPTDVLDRVRDELRTAGLIVHDTNRQWSLRYPVLGERLRIDLDSEFERLLAEFAR